MPKIGSRMIGLGLKVTTIKMSPGHAAANPKATNVFFRLKAFTQKAADKLSSKNSRIFE